MTRTIMESAEGARRVAARACHETGMFMMNAALPLARTVVGVPVAVASFAAGWALQITGHSLLKPLDVVFEDDGIDEATALILG